MNKVLIIVLSLLIGFYSGIAYYGYSHESTDEKLEKLEYQLQSLHNKFDDGLTITITE